MDQLRKYILELQSYCNQAERMNGNVSEVNVSWHIQHCLLVIHKSIQALLLSKPEDYKSEFNFPRIILFYLKWFPRGKGKAPDRVKPQTTDNIDFQPLFDKAEIHIQKLEQALSKQYMPHPIFGKLDKQQTMTMLTLHTLHHIRIIKDIVKNG